MYVPSGTYTFRPNQHAINSFPVDLIWNAPYNRATRGFKLNINERSDAKVNKRVRKRCRPTVHTTVGIRYIRAKLIVRITCEYFNLSSKRIKMCLQNASFIIAW